MSDTAAVPVSSRAVPASFLLGLVLLSLMLLARPAVGQDLQPCEDRFGPTARCGWIEVPEDRSAPAGRAIRLRLVVLPAAAAAAPEPVLMFPGGPGQATSDLIGLARQVYPGVQESRDIVFIGQRGTGESNPLHCTLDVSADPAAAFGGLFDPARVRDCYREARRHADPNHYTTADYIADIDAAMTALGYDRAILWGGSGGTRTATAFARAYPDRVIGMVLDGVTPLDYAMPLPFSRFVQSSWERVVEDCAAQPGCRAAYPSLDRDMETVLARFAAGPVRATVTLPDGGQREVQLTRGDFAYALRGILYNANATASLPARLHEAAASGELSFFAQSHFDRSRALRGAVVAMGLHLSVYCAEDVPLLESRAVARETEGTILGGYLVEQYRGACEVWPMRAMPAEWYRPFRSDIPVVFMSGYYDPSTPAIAAEHVARSFPNHLHIVVRNMGHGAGFTCARPVVEQFLITASLAGLANPCSEEPIRFVVEQ